MKNNCKLKMLNLPNNNYNPIKKSEIAICPNCKKGCKLSLNGYNITCSCKYGHESTHTIIEFDQTQYVDLKKVKCDFCSKFVYEDDCNHCLECNKNYCNYCINFLYSEINKSNCEHYIVPYSIKEYYCKEHKELFESFCLDCRKDLCLLCLSSHENENHNIKEFDLDKEQRRQIVNTSDILFNKVEQIIHNFITRINSIKKVLKSTYKIFREINLNYGNVRTLENLSNQNVFDLNYFIKDFQNIIKIAESENDDIKIYELINILYNKNISTNFATHEHRDDKKSLKINSNNEEVKHPILVKNLVLNDKNGSQQCSNNDNIDNINKNNKEINNNDNYNEKDNDNDNSNCKILNQENVGEVLIFCNNNNYFDIVNNAENGSNQDNYTKKFYSNDYFDNYNIQENSSKKIYDNEYQNIESKQKSFDNYSSIAEKFTKEENESSKFTKTLINLISLLDYVIKGYYKNQEYKTIKTTKILINESYYKINNNKNNKKSYNNKHNNNLYNNNKIRLKLSFDNINFHFISKVMKFISFINSKHKINLKRKLVNIEKINPNVKYLPDEFNLSDNDLLNDSILSLFKEENKVLYISYLIDGILISFTGKIGTMILLKYPYGYLLANILHKIGFDFG